ncbi:hypothetical protein Q8A73_008076 [Channa argus]|nr:hypothetical protein Q8A73_008076 [Channa argus]
MSPLVLKKDKGQKGADIKSVGPMDTSRKLVQDPWSIEQIGPQGPHRASREWIDFHSEEEMIVVAHEVSQLPGQKIINLHADKVTGGTSQRANIQRKAGRVDVLNGMVAQDESRELDRDSLEDRQNNGRPYPVGNSRDRDWDETQECISSETHSQVSDKEEGVHSEKRKLLCFFSLMPHLWILGC